MLASPRDAQRVSWLALWLGLSVNVRLCSDSAPERVPETCQTPVALGWDDSRSVTDYEAAGKELELLLDLVEAAQRLAKVRRRGSSTLTQALENGNWALDAFADDTDEEAYAAQP